MAFAGRSPGQGCCVAQMRTAGYAVLIVCWTFLFSERIKGRLPLRVVFTVVFVDLLEKFGSSTAGRVVIGERG